MHTGQKEINLFLSLCAIITVDQTALADADRTETISMCGVFLDFLGLFLSQGANLKKWKRHM